MDVHAWSAAWSWAKTNGMAAFLGAAAVKVLERVEKIWKRRLSPMEKLVLVLALESGGSLKWDENVEGGAPLLSYRYCYFKKEGNIIEPSVTLEEFADQSEMSALIAKGYMEVSNGGYQRRLIADGYGKARSIRSAIEKKGISAIKRLSGDLIQQVRDYYLAIPWWRPIRRWSLPKSMTAKPVSEVGKAEA